jgi:purine-binding chemotaxis protein CheW
MGKGKQLCTFVLGDLLCGMEVDRVQEVLRFREMTDVPLAPASVRGLINLRGQIVTAIDLRQRLGMEPLPEGGQPMNIVIRVADGMVSLLVDEIRDVLEVDERLYEPPPESIDDALKQLVRGVYKLEKRQLLLQLDLDRMLDVEHMGEVT